MKLAFTKFSVTRDSLIRPRSHP